MRKTYISRGAITWPFSAALAALWCLATLSPAQAAETELKSLPGHVPDVVKTLSPFGTADPASQLTLAIGLPLRDTNGLDACLAQLCDPASPSYRQYLTPAQFTEKFGPTTNDYSSVVAFARQNNLTITALHGNRLLLDVTGSVSNIQQAFHITLRTYHHPTEARDFYAPDTDPSVDSSLPIADVSGLNNYSPPHPKSIRVESHSAHATALTGSGPGGASLGGDFRAAYLPGVTMTGSGQQLGLLEFDGFYAGDISSYESKAGMAPVPVQTVLLDGFDGTPTTGSDSGNPEVSLDIEAAMAMAPGLSNIVVFEAGPGGEQNDILNSMAENDQVKQLSSSWGWSGGPSTTTDAIFKEMAAQGQSFFNASGDSDAFTVGASSSHGVDNSSMDDAPASSPYITQVGATTLTTTGPGGAWSSETVWNWGLDGGSYVGTSGGVSSYYSIPTWQAGINMTANGGSTAFRNIPDVALTGDNVFVTYGNGTSGAFGGTSCAAPLWAALASLANQQAESIGNSSVGFVNPAIYALGKSAAYTSSFHDITTGNNFSSSSPANYSAVAGYDLCSGWGTPFGQSLINALAGAPNSLIISPAAGFSVTGPVGGPFGSASQTFALSNATSSAVTWAVGNPSSWLAAVPATGSLAAYGSATVTVTLTPDAASLPASAYASEITFTNLNSTTVQNIPFDLQVGQSIVQNGGFETGSFTDWTLVGDTTSGKNVYDAVESSSSSPTVVHSGNYGAALGDTKLATLSQTLATTPGQTYVLSLWLDNLGAGADEQFLVNWNSTTLYNQANPPAFSWTNLQFVVTATSSSTVLQLGAENASSYFGLDDISVTPIPSLGFRSAALSAGNFSLAWNTATGLTYQVQYTTNLAPPVWVNLGSPIVATGSSLFIADTNVNSSTPQCFYRLILSQ